jgi:putative transposase
MEEICKHEAYCGKRIKRGLYISKDAIKINADVNGNYNILRKAIPSIFNHGIEGHQQLN